MSGARCTRSLACKCETKHTSVVTTGSPGSPGIPARNGFNGLYRALPGERIRLVTVIGGLRFCQARLGPTRLRKFSTSNGCQDHTALPYAEKHLSSARRLSLTRFISPCNHVARQTLPRPPHPAPRQ